MRLGTHEPLCGRRQPLTALVLEIAVRSIGRIGANSSVLRYEPVAGRAVALRAVIL
jgi:hypothetical protein